MGNAVQRWCARAARRSRGRRAADALASFSRAFERFCEALQAAKGGDANSMELLAQMLNEGYGCSKDVAQARGVLRAGSALGDALRRVDCRN